METRTISNRDYDWQASNGWMHPGGTQHKQEHDAFLRLAKQRLTDPAQVVKQGADYQYDAASNITAITKHERSAQTEGELAQSPATYGYDALDRLTSVSKTTTTNTTRTENYQYDAVGNRINSTGTDTVDGSYTHNANHALTNLDVSAGEGGDEGEEEPGTWTFQYNANGAITQKAFTPTGATAPTKTWTYGWNRQNRLSTVHYNGAHIASYAYDPFGRRIKKSVHSSITGGTTGTTYYLYNDSGLVAEYTQTGQLNTEYHYVPGSHWSTNPLFARDGETNEIYYAATDQLGTATALIKSSGQVVWKAEKTAFGKTTTTAENNAAGNPVQFNLRFPGQYEDQETGLHYNWMRYYDAEIGRYVKRDPIGLQGGVNVYEYARSAVTKFIDPSGLLVQATYCVDTGMLTVYDPDTGESVVTDAESGGKPFGDPLPEGDYEILDRAGDPDMYRLDPKDPNPRDDTHDETGRDHFRLHKPGRTVGCIAAKNQDDWERVKDVLDKTRREEVDDNFKPWFKPWASPEKIDKYGDLTVKKCDPPGGWPLYAGQGR